MARKKVAPKRAKKSVQKVAKKAARKAAPKKAAAKASPSKKAVKKIAPLKSAAKKAASKKVATKKGAAKTAPVAAGRVVVENVNVPGYKSTVDATKYEAMRGVLLRVLPKSPAGLTQSEMFAAVEGKLPEALFPGQEKAGWWVKCVQLDLEAKGAMKRTATKPIRWHRT